MLFAAINVLPALPAFESVPAVFSVADSVSGVVGAAVGVAVVESARRGWAYAMRLREAQKKLLASADGVIKNPPKSA